MPIPIMGHEWNGMTARLMSYEFMDLTQHETDVLLAVATLYVDAFDDENEMMTLPERMSLQEVEKILDRHGRRY